MSSVDTDVVVVGAGNAALVAALAAHEQGARVIVLEAASHEERGGNSRFSGGIFRVVHDGLGSLKPMITDESKNWLERVEVDPYTEQRYFEDIMAPSGGRPDSTLVRRLVDESYDTVRWMHGQGVDWELTVGKLLDPDKLDSDEKYVLPPGGALRSAGEGVGLVENLFQAAEAAEGIEIWYDSPAASLILEGSTVRGIRVRHSDEDLDVFGTVVLASGGFEANPEMRLRYLGEGWDLVKVRGTRFNMGTMISRVLDAGGQPSGHWGGCHAVPLDADAPEIGDLALTDKMSRYSYPFSLMVNVDSKRFVDEGEDEVWLTYAKTGAAIRQQPRALAFQIFDQKTAHLLEPRYSTGTPVEAETLRDLARKLDLDPEALERTVEEFNKDTQDGEFSPYRKDGLTTRGSVQPSKSNWAQPLDEPPFICYRVTCGITFTYGGLKIDENARVLDTEGHPMPGLFATGELAGGFFYNNYPAGAGLVRGAVFGKIAGANAASLSHERQPTA